MICLWKKAGAVLLALCLLTAVAVLPAAAETTDLAPTPLSDPPVTASDAVIVIEADTGTVLYDKNAHTPHYPASCTKILTAILALENGVMTDQVTMSYEAIFGIDRSSSHIALDVGETASVSDLLHALLIASANECALGLAEYTSAKCGGDGTVADFVERMNQRAAELGAQNTHFVNPNGLYDENHTTTPYDLAQFMKHAITLPDFVSISRTPYYTVRTNRVPDGHPFVHTNKTIGSGKYYYSDVVCGKSGYTKQSGSSLVTYAKRNGTGIIVVTMGTANIDDTYTDTLALLDYFLGNYRTVTPDETDVVTGELPVNSSVSIPVYSSLPSSVTLPVGFSLKDLSYQFQANPDILFPLKAGDTVGAISWFYGDYTLATGLLCASFAMEQPATPSQKTPQETRWVSTVLRVLGILLAILAGLIFLFLLAALINRTVRKRRRKQRIRRAGRY